MNPRVLIFDIETRYIIFRGWRTGKQFVDQSQIVLGEDSDIICISYKWLGEKQIHTLHWGLQEQSSANMIEAFSKVVESADLCVGHNCDGFDIKHINTQRLLHNQPPIAWPSSEDTLKQIRKQFYLPSYRLDYLSKLLTGTGKAKMDFSDWIDVVEKKSTKALKKMIHYNRRDVKKLEEAYKIIAPHLKPKLHVGIVTGAGKDVCTRCGSKESRSKGIVYLTSGKYRRRQCKACVTIYRGAKI